MKRIIIIFYHIFFFTISLRFIYVSTIHVIRNACRYIYFILLYVFIIFIQGFFSNTLLVKYRPLHFVMPCILLKNKKQNKTCIAVITRLTYVAMLSAIDPVVNLALMVFLSNGSNIRHSSVSRCPTSQISPVLCRALKDFNMAVNEHLLAI